jgi:hypothetical protein
VAVEIDEPWGGKNVKGSTVNNNSHSVHKKKSTAFNCNSFLLGVRGRGKFYLHRVLI